MRDDIENAMAKLIPVMTLHRSAQWWDVYWFLQQCRNVAADPAYVDHEAKFLGW